MAYATRTELADMGGLPSVVVATFTDGEQDAALEQASAVADGYLRSEYEIPLETAGADLKMHVCRLAAYFLMRRRGFDPERGSDVVIREDYKDALAWLTKVSRGEVVLAGETDATPDIDESMPVILSGLSRGW